jgi:hypothetical protein
MAITHQYQGQLRRVQLTILGAFVVALVVLGIVWHHSSPTSTRASVTQVVTTYLRHAGIASDLYTVHVTTSPSQPSWALFREVATRKGEATFQNTYGVAEKVSRKWKMVDWGTALVGCVQRPHASTIPALIMKDLGMACPAGWN